MPTLIRLLVLLLILAGLVFGGMIALTAMVDPGEKDVTLRIPTRELVPPVTTSDPLGLQGLPAPVNIAPPASSSAAPESAPADITSDDESGEATMTVEPGAPE
jgi:hypothetical protein